MVEKSSSRRGDYTKVQTPGMELERYTETTISFFT